MNTFARVGPADGNLSRQSNVEEVSSYGFKIDIGWTLTDPAGHVHTAEGFFASTYQPREEMFCEEHGEVEDRAVGARRCRMCDVEVIPTGYTGPHTVLVPRDPTWTVEYIGRGCRYLWRGVPDELGTEIFEAKAIHPFLERLGDEVGPPVEEEWWSP